MTDATSSACGPCRKARRTYCEVKARNVETNNANTTSDAWCFFHKSRYQPGKCTNHTAPRQRTRWNPVPLVTMTCTPVGTAPIRQHHTTNLLRRLNISSANHCWCCSQTCWRGSSVQGSNRVSNPPLNTIAARTAAGQENQCLAFIVCLQGQCNFSSRSGAFTISVLVPLVVVNRWHIPP